MKIYTGEAIYRSILLLSTPVEQDVDLRISLFERDVDLRTGLAEKDPPGKSGCRMSTLQVGHEIEQRGCLSARLSAEPRASVILVCLRRSACCRPTLPSQTVAWQRN